MKKLFWGFNYVVHRDNFGKDVTFNKYIIDRFRQTNNLRKKLLIRTKALKIAVICCSAFDIFI